MSRKAPLLATVACLGLLAVALASPRAGSALIDEPITCPYCGGNFTIESFAMETGARLTLRTVRILTGS